MNKYRIDPLHLIILAAGILILAIGLKTKDGISILTGIVLIITSVVGMRNG